MIITYGIRPDMPNKRAKNKRLIGGFVDEKVAAAFKAYAKSRGVTVADALKQIVEEELKRKGMTHERR